MAQGVPEGLHRQLQPIQFTDSEIRRVMKNASDEADKIIATMGKKGTTSAAVRSAQASMSKVSAQMWAGVGDAAKVGIGDAVYSATEMQALFDETLFGSAGFSSTYWRASMIAQSKEGINSLISRKENGITLSQRVYKNSALSKGKIDDIINKHLLLGNSARDIAKEVKAFINPNVPGGASYAAMRLGRSEVQNAFHRTSVRNYQQTPWVETVKWNLSGSHPKPDACNEYSEDVTFPGGEAGMYRPTEVPDKPHPNCLCFVTPEVMDLDKFVKAFKDGKFDGYIEQTMGCHRGA